MTLSESADRTFLALMIWREARGESTEARVAVGYTVLERIKSKAGWWGSDVLSVLFCKWQYSSLTDPRDQQLTLWPRSDQQAWRQCLDIADVVLSGTVNNPAPGADSYFDISIKAPNWATPDRHVADIGRLKFYKARD